ncbi:MAG: hypothetical protein HOP11_02075 [Saprospiraceae bacterium]|nr:hypothetical protein [Saprospiraceae bacterium]
MIIVSRKLIKLLTGNFAIALTVWPFIFIRSKHHSKNHILINHENIHLRQQVELLIVFFYIWYSIEYLVYRMQGKSKLEAYHKISFEKEAYAKESNIHYLKERKLFAFIKYLN